MNDTLEALGYPTLEELARIGISGREFFYRYVRAVQYRSGLTPAIHAKEVLRAFDRDHPGCRRATRSGEAAEGNKP
ncbi:MAG TPA: hypothetical protein VH022_14325 [Candidatus Acidoferrum sp.]|jgi:hypothetical protein|nr:hypothetical protein [Candidatus Acidoferrum sp.]